MPTIHVHLDEAGNLDFSSSGTKYYVFAVTWTYNPRPIALRLNALRYMFLKNGHDIPFFHASEDREPIRSEVVKLLGDEGWWRFAAIVIEKAKVDPVFYQNLHMFYSTFATMPLRFVFRSLKGSKKSRRALIYTDSIPIGKHKEYAEKAIKTALRAELPPSTTFHIYHHPSASNYWLQVADYCSWAVFRKWERADPEFYSILSSRLVHPERDVLAQETSRHY